jgi:hypothetical protein
MEKKIKIKCTKPSHALSTMNKKFRYEYQFGIPSILLDCKKY